MLIKYWEKIVGKETRYIYLYDNGLFMGHHFGSGHTDTGGSCTIDEFKKGRFQDYILQGFGEKTLKEVLEKVKEIS